MKVILVNGSPHEKGCTYTALKEVASALEQGGHRNRYFLDRYESYCGLYCLSRLCQNWPLRFS